MEFPHCMEQIGSGPLSVSGNRQQKVANGTDVGHVLFLPYVPSDCHFKVF